MKATMVGLLLAMLGGAGCAHGVINNEVGRDVRGSAQLNDGARLLVVGPASSVHTSAGDGDRSVALYMVDARTGDDRDCGASAHRTAVDAGAGGHIQVPQGRALCAAKANGAVADVLWHGHADDSQEMWARR
jgi:hypothetical protein